MNNFFDVNKKLSINTDKLMLAYSKIANKLGIEFFDPASNLDAFHKKLEEQYVHDDAVDIAKMSQELELPQSCCFSIAYTFELGSEYICNQSINPRIQELFDSIDAEDKVLNTELFGFPVTIAIPSVKLAISFKDMYYDSALFKNRTYCQRMVDTLESNGWKLFTIFEHNDLSIWKSMIANKLGQSKRCYARKLDLKAIPYSITREFLQENHLQGTVKTTLNYALYDNDGLLEVLTFCKSRFNRNYDYELIRLCTKKNYSIVGGASRLFNAFLKEHKNAKITTYANRQFSQGGIYEKLGFTFLRKTQPNYVYFRYPDIFTRVICQKAKLKALDEYSPERSEVEIMKRSKFFQIFDCGNYVYEFINR